MVDLRRLDEGSQRGAGDGSLQMIGQAHQAMHVLDRGVAVERKFLGLLRGEFHLGADRRCFPPNSADKDGNVLRRQRGTLGKLSHFVRHDGKTTTLLARPRGLDGGIESEKIGLVGDPLDHLHDSADLANSGVQIAHGHGGFVSAVGRKAQVGVDALDSLYVGPQLNRSFNALTAFFAHLLRQGGHRTLHHGQGHAEGMELIEQGRLNLKSWRLFAAQRPHGGQLALHCGDPTVLLHVAGTLDGQLIFEFPQFVLMRPAKHGFPR